MDEARVPESKMATAGVDLFEVHIRGLPSEMTRKELWNLFADYTPHPSVFLAKQDVQQELTYGFVRFGALDMAERVIREKNGLQLSGKYRLTLELARRTKEAIVHSYYWKQDNKTNNEVFHDSLSKHKDYIDEDSLSKGDMFPKPPKAVQDLDGDRNNNACSQNLKHVEATKVPPVAPQSPVRVNEQSGIAELMTEVVLSSLRTDPVILGSSEHMVARLKLRKNCLKTQKHKLQLKCGSSSLPTMYRFVLAEGTPSSFRRIVYDEKKSSEEFVCPRLFKNQWLTYCQKTRDEIFGLLQQILCVGFYLERKEKEWQVCSLFEDGDHHYMQGISSYGGVNLHKGVLGRRSEKQLMNWFQDIHITEDLTYEFVAAFENELQDGMGHTAMRSLVKYLTKMIKRESKETILNVHFGNRAFPHVNDGLSLTSLKSNGLPSYTSLMVYNQGQVDCNPNSPTLVSQPDHADYEPQGVDIFVLYNNETNNGRYLLLVNIMSSKQSSFEQLKAGLIKEMLCLMKDQRNVFGLLMSATEAQLIRMYRNADHDHNIQVGSISYDFLEAEDTFGSYTLDCASLQKLSLDILTCMVFGMEYTVLQY